MPKIIIATPCHTVHRFLLPPSAEHVVHCEFVGGGICLAQMLGLLLNPDDQASSAAWKDQVKEIQKKDADNGEDEKGVRLLPQRFLRLGQFDPPPNMVKHLKPDTKFLRVQEKQDGAGYNETVQAAFVCESKGKGRDLYVIGGMDPARSWDAVLEAAPGKKPGKGDIVYLVPKDAPALEAHIKHLNDKLGLKAGQRPLVIGQIDLADLARVYPIQEDTSYERTVGDICRAQKPDEQAYMLDELVCEKGLDHLFIRIGNAACVLVSRSQIQEHGKPLPKVVLYYHPDRCAPTSSPGLGIMLAHDLVVTACMVAYLANDEEKTLANGKEDELLKKATSAAVQATYRCFLEGFGKFKNGDNDVANTDAAQLFARYVGVGRAIQKGDVKFLMRLGVMEPDLKVLSGEKVENETTEKPPPKTESRTVKYEVARSPNRFWRMMLEDFNPGEKERFSERSAAACFKIARAYLLKKKREEPEKEGEEGKEIKALPIVKIGKQMLVDRHEVEDYLFLQHLLVGYLHDTGWKKPLCIGVFGQPGAGKSFGITQLVSAMSGDDKSFARDAITINLSQLRTLDELMESFHRIRDACLSRSMPLVFFDEFDSSFEGKAFGWLKYFLAPMQDGEFLEKGRAYHFGKAIFVFAGGVNHSFAEFNQRSRNPDFCDAKGPDFISRLRGILNVKGMNMPEGDEIEHIYMIRRAVFLRYKLAERWGSLNENAELISPQLAKAFLTIPRFKHGVRSMEAIVDMSTIPPREKFVHSHLPPRDQLDMHVDAREFLGLAGVSTPQAK